MIEIPVLNADVLIQKLEAGHRVEWNEVDPRTGRQLFFVCQKRGAEYVTCCGTSEAQARKHWDKAHEKGYYYDERTRRRVSIPGTR